ncbi:hypothetical protein [Micromonospora endolithica]|uniref:DUF4367 domain-containing protein n=1 Tax=Micromonospora endolithica TaxID=230091 RepID=A0A3A9ZDI5_9ACTN|nr:hypothetical protein [Micromonospora endolithica]RKN45367.1 hypothetical protein D7223_17305 [Micromonospora endolithica]TWJ22928.1 hypothetical protein JD76_03051 [Micromonospora endolithica]
MDDLERELRDLSGWLETPDAPDVTAGVRVRLATPAPRWRRWRYSAAAVLVALVVAVLPPGRAALADAVAGLVRFAGIRIVTSTGPASPAATPSPLPSRRPVALDEARRAVRFPLRVPAKLGPPEQVQVADPDATGAHRVATLLYRGGALRVDAFDGRVDLLFLKRAVGPGVALAHVDGGLAVWVDGPHALTYVDRAGTVREETARLAASTLIWQEGDVAYRLEGALTRDEAVAIADSLD